MSDTGFLIREIESFFVGGRDVTLSGLPVERRRMAQGGPPRLVDPNGDVVTGQMYAQLYRQMRPASPLPVLLWHGGGMSGACWETTPDGRPGWLSLLLRRGFDVCVSDAVERGRASWSRYPEIYAEAPVFRTKDEAWVQFRIGPEGGYAHAAAARVAFAPTLFPVEAFDGFAAQFVPRWSGHEAMTQAAYDALVARIGACVLVAHSQGCAFALQAAARAPALVRAVVLLEPSGAPQDAPIGGPPVLVIWGDNIETSALWQRYRATAEAYLGRLRDAGRAVDVIDLPARGVRGNSHFLMMDRNSAEIAAMVGGWVAESVG
jgi:pimeloyl-ACP methyl ester carboxylesterase